MLDNGSCGGYISEQRGATEIEIMVFVSEKQHISVIEKNLQLQDFLV